MANTHGVLSDIAAEERRDDEGDTPRAGLSAYALACLESELGHHVTVQLPDLLFGYAAPVVPPTRLA
jgi:hypothetical protein